MPEETKQCTKCKEIKLLSDFPKDRQKSDGLSSICKKCNKDKVNAYMQTEQGKATRKVYEQTSEFKLKRSQYNKSERGKQKHKKYRKSDNGKQVANKRKRFSRNEKARYAVHGRVRLGKMEHPSTLKCVDCGNQAHEYHHHKGYEPENWLDVIPLCKPCHQLRHQFIPTFP